MGVYVMKDYDELFHNYSKLELDKKEISIVKK